MRASQRNDKLKATAATAEVIEQEKPANQNLWDTAFMTCQECKQYKLKVKE
jgi:hypothetical protein